MTKLINIVLPIHNRSDHTKQTLESLFNHTDPALYSLYLIDDASSNVIKNLLLTFTDIVKEKNITVIAHRNEENIGPAASRNNMCSYITQTNERGEYLYLSDNDVYFQEDWLPRLIDTYERVEHLGIKLLGGGCHPYLQNRNKLVHPFTKEELDNPIRKGPHSVYDCSCGASTIVGIKDAVSGYSQLMTWKTWDEYGPLDEGSRGQEKKIAGSEDWAMCQRIKNQGFLVGSLEPEVVIHTGRTNTYNEPATGAETIRDVEGVMVK